MPRRVPGGGWAGEPPEVVQAVAMVRGQLGLPPPEPS